MTTPNPTISPMAQRFIASGHAARPRADYTLGDKVAADRTECAYCGLTIAEGATSFDGRGLDQYCRTDKALGACRHGGICDCSAGICE
jgi:hypothetical protein